MFPPRSTRCHRRWRTGLAEPLGRRPFWFRRDSIVCCRGPSTLLHGAREGGSIGRVKWLLIYFLAAGAGLLSVGAFVAYLLFLVGAVSNSIDRLKDKRRKKRDLRDDSPVAKVNDYEVNDHTIEPVANLDGTDLTKPDEKKLKGERFKGANLKGAGLGGLNLEGEDFEGANLMGAHLASSNLKGANLKGADLYGANLKGADLYGAVADEDTRWPAWFDPVKYGVIFED
jgi:hypothetical protein